MIAVPIGAALTSQNPSEWDTVISIEEAPLGPVISIEEAPLGPVISIAAAGWATDGCPDSPESQVCDFPLFLGNHESMGLIFRKTFRLGPFRFNFTKHGFSSWSFRLWRWSWNSKQRQHRIDLPGPASWTSKPN